MPLYFFPRFTSRLTNFNASSTTHLMSFKLDNSWFSFAQVTTCLIESTCVTSAPADLAAMEAPPVYANKLSTLGSFIFIALMAFAA